MAERVAAVEPVARPRGRLILSSETPVSPSLAHVATWSVRRGVVNFVDDRCTLLAAAISYFALFSMFPLVLLAAAVFGVVLRDEALQARVLDAIVGAIPVHAPTVASSLRALANLGPTLSIVSLLGAVWASGALATAVRSALEVVFDVDRGRPYFLAKVMDYVIVLGAGLLFLTSTVITTGWQIIQAHADRLGFAESGFSWLWSLGGLVLPAVTTFLTFLLLYRALPHRATRLLHIWPGALLAAILFELAKNGFALYLAYFGNYQVVYGSLGGVIALLFWVYISANILLFGAEVSAEVGHVMRGEPRRGHVPGEEGDWRRSLRQMLRGLLFAPPTDQRRP
jgi:membrane protein